MNSLSATTHPEWCGRYLEYHEVKNEIIEDCIDVLTSTSNQYNTYLAKYLVKPGQGNPKLFWRKVRTKTHSKKKTFKWLPHTLQCPVWISSLKSKTF